MTKLTSDDYSRGPRTNRRLFARSSLFILIILIVLMCVVCSTSRRTSTDAPEKKGQGAMSLSRVDTPRQLASRIDSLFSASPTSEVDRLMSATDCTVALSAGWERVLRTMPRAEQQDYVSPDAAILSRFLGLVDERTQTLVPEAWSAAVQSVKGLCRTGVWFSCPDIVEEALKNRQGPQRDGQEWIIEKDGLSIRVPMEPGQVWVDNVAVHLDTEVAYIAVYGWPPVPYRLYAIDRGSKEVIWSTKVWAAGGLIDYQGRGWHYAQMTLSGGTLTVFGVSEGVAYIEIFDKKTGENQCRFSTMYLALL